MNLNIQIESFESSKKIIQPNDTIRVIVTTFPDDQSQAINIDVKTIEQTQPVFTVGVTKLTKKIIIVFRKKSNSKKDLIIGSTIIRSDQFPNKINDKYNTEMRSIPIYEPFPNDSGKNISILENRKILGKMEVRIALSEISQSENNTYL